MKAEAETLGQWMGCGYDQNAFARTMNCHNETLFAAINIYLKNQIGNGATNVDLCFRCPLGECVSFDTLLHFNVDVILTPPLKSPSELPACYRE